MISSSYGYESIPINTIFRGMNIHLPAILIWTTGVQGFDPLPYINPHGIPLALAPHGPWSMLGFYSSRVSLRGLVGATNAALGSCALGKRWRNAVDVLSHLGRFAASFRRGTVGVFGRWRLRVWWIDHLGYKLGEGLIQSFWSMKQNLETRRCPTYVWCFINPIWIL